MTHLRGRARIAQAARSGRGWYRKLGTKTSTAACPRELAARLPRAEDSGRCDDALADRYTDAVTERVMQAVDESGIARALPAFEPPGDAIRECVADSPLSIWIDLPGPPKK